MKTLVSLHIPDSKEAGVFVNNSTMTLINVINQKIISLIGNDSIIRGFSKILQGGIFYYNLEMNEGYYMTDIQRELHELVSQIPGTSIQ